jgi:sec-independent protein translocase protein TatA
MRLGVPELIIILVIVLLIFGAGRLPAIGAALGKGIRAFRKSTGGSQATVRSRKSPK